MKITAALFAVLPTAVVAFAPSPISSTRSSMMLRAETESANAETEPKASSESMFQTMLDEEDLLAKSDFPIKAADLIARAQYIIGPDCGIGTKDGAECLAEDFEFCAAVVGPIPRKDYLQALENFDLEAAWDITSNYFGMTVDPLQPNRVWFMNRVTGIHTGTFLGTEATGKEVIYPPQTLHLDFNADGQVTEFGFYSVDRRQGNTGGLGGAFGFINAVGKTLPIREFQPYKPSKRYRLFQLFGKLMQKLQKKKDE